MSWRRTNSSAHRGKFKCSRACLLSMPSGSEKCHEAAEDCRRQSILQCAARPRRIGGIDSSQILQVCYRHFGVAPQILSASRPSHVGLDPCQDLDKHC